MVKFIRYGYIGLLILYVLAGVRLAPFHGDESTIIYMSSDFDTLFLRGDLAHIEYSNPPPADDPQAATKQDLRLLNGVVNKYTYGLAWWLSGFTVKDLNQQWVWGTDYTYNQSQNTIPSPTLLFVCRWASALLTVLSVAVMAVVAKRAGGWRAALLAATIYTLIPAVLLNGRRAVFESSLLLFSALLIYVGQRILSQRWTARWVIGLGLAAGLTVASKHTGVIVIVAVFLVLTVDALVARPMRRKLSAVVSIGAALGLMCAVFFALNASWWSNPVIMPFGVLRGRTALLNGQAAGLDPYTDSAQRVSALIRETFSAPPQYFEDREDWPHWIGDQIAAYQASLLGGLSGALWSIVLAVLFVIGVVRAMQQWRGGASFLILAWFAIAALSLFALTPLDWQRYYLPVMMPMTVICGMAAMQPTRRTRARLDRAKLRVVA